MGNTPTGEFEIHLNDRNRSPKRNTTPSRTQASPRPTAALRNSLHPSFAFGKDKQNSADRRNTSIDAFLYEIDVPDFLGMEMAKALEFSSDYLGTVMSSKMGLCLSKSSVFIGKGRQESSLKNLGIKSGRLLEIEKRLSTSSRNKADGKSAIISKVLNREIEFTVESFRNQYKGKLVKSLPVKSIREQSRFVPETLKRPISTTPKINTDLANKTSSSNKASVPSPQIPNHPSSAIFPAPVTKKPQTNNPSSTRAREERSSRRPSQLTDENRPRVPNITSLPNNSPNTYIEDEPSKFIELMTKYQSTPSQPSPPITHNTLESSRGINGTNNPFFSSLKKSTERSSGTTTNNIATDNQEAATPTLQNTLHSMRNGLVFSFQQQTLDAPRISDGSNRFKESENLEEAIIRASHKNKEKREVFFKANSNPSNDGSSLNSIRSPKVIKIDLFNPNNAPKVQAPTSLSSLADKPANFLKKPMKDSQSFANNLKGTLAESKGIPRHEFGSIETEKLLDLGVGSTNESSKDTLPQNFPMVTRDEKRSIGSGIKFNPNSCFKK
jgi:hypothetical protein